MPVFVKQLGSNPFLERGGLRQTSLPGGFMLEGSFEHKPIELRDSKGGDMSEWDSDLRVREFPTPAGT